MVARRVGGCWSAWPSAREPAVPPTTRIRATDAPTAHASSPAATRPRVPGTTGDRIRSHRTGPRTRDNDEGKDGWGPAHSSTAVRESGTTAAGGEGRRNTTRERRNLEPAQPVPRVGRERRSDKLSHKLSKVPEPQARHNHRRVTRHNFATVLPGRDAQGGARTVPGPWRRRWE